MDILDGVIVWQFVAVVGFMMLVYTVYLFGYSVDMALALFGRGSLARSRSRRR